MRVYHFVNEVYGLDDLCRRRLKIATLNELNDPFELFGVNLKNENLRRAFRLMKDELSTKRGILCFSRSWHNPVQWSHYAAKHTGLCLGFDIPDEHLCAVNYSSKRLAIEVERFQQPHQFSLDLAKQLLFTKYSHWRYENEVRAFATLEDKDPESGLYFANFSDELKLTTVIVGAESRVTRNDIQSTLGDFGESVDVFKARLAFNTFRVVKQRNEGYWA